MTSKTIMQQVKEVVATADYNRNVHKALSPEDSKTIDSMINDIDQRVAEMNEAKDVLKGCLNKTQELYT